MCDRLNVCLPSKFICRNPNPQCDAMVFGGGAFGRCLGYEGGAVGNGTSAHRVLRSPGKWGHRRQSFMKEEADPRETDLCVLFFRALCYHWWCFMYFYLASKKIYSSGLPLPARHYHTNQRWRLPQLPRSDSQLPKTLCCCSWYWAFSQQWRQPRNWGFWKVLPWVQRWNTPVLSYKYHTPNPKFLHRQRFGWGPLGEKVWRDCSAVGCWANFLFSFSASPCQALLWEKGFSNLDSHIQVFSPLSLFEGQWTGSQSLLWNSWYLGILLGISPFLNVFFFF